MAILSGARNRPGHCMTGRRLPFPLIRQFVGMALRVAAMPCDPAADPSVRPMASQPGRPLDIRSPWNCRDRNGNGSANPGEFLIIVKYGSEDGLVGAG